MKNKPNAILKPVVAEIKTHLVSSDDNESHFFTEIATILQEGRKTAYRAVNSVMVETYWKVGRRIVEQEQGGKERADYGDYLIERLSRYLGDTFGKGFSEANLLNFRRFYTKFPDFDQFRTHCVLNLTWTNIRQIIRIDDAKERDYYLREAAEQNWSSRILERNIKTGYYRRLLSSQQTAEKTNSPAIADITGFINDPYILEFLNVPEDLTGKETQLEAALINDLQKFLLECEEETTMSKLDHLTCLSPGRIAAVVVEIEGR